MMTVPRTSSTASRLAFFFGIAFWAVLARSGKAADVRQCESADYRIPHARFSADMEVALRNENWKEMAGVCSRIQAKGGFPDWMLEYGRLLLDSCPERAILFTGSLADTDSALYWQSVRGYRRDVAVLPMGFLDRIWFMESVSRKHGISLTLESEIASDNTVSPDFTSKGYSKDILSCFSRILRGNVNSRPICLSMDLSPDLLQSMLPNLGIRGFVFQCPDFQGNLSEAYAVTARLLLNADGFKGLAPESLVRSCPDSLRSHYRFIAKAFLARSGNRLRPDDRDRLISLITGPFSPYAVDAETSVYGSGTSGSQQEP
jgi:hypothetical protein